MRGKVLKGATQIVNYLLPQWVHEGDVVIDATCGNGNDTLTLANLVGTMVKYMVSIFRNWPLHQLKRS